MEIAWACAGDCHLSWHQWRFVAVRMCPEQRPSVNTVSSSRGLLGHSATHTRHPPLLAAIQPRPHDRHPTVRGKCRTCLAHTHISMDKIACHTVINQDRDFLRLFRNLGLQLQLLISGNCNCNQLCRNCMCTFQRNPREGLFPKPQIPNDPTTALNPEVCKTEETEQNCF
eukprot:2961294-Amphidinium_carterae.1